MNVKTVKKPKRRVDIGYVSRFKMQAYGYDNLYPQNLARITEASGTAKQLLTDMPDSLRAMALIATF